MFSEKTHRSSIFYTYSSRIRVLLRWLTTKRIVTNSSKREIIVSDDIVERFPKPSPELQCLIDKVPDTGLILYYREIHHSINKEWKSWAYDMMEVGYQQPSIIQLAGEDLTMNPFEFEALVDSVFNELGIHCPQDVGKYQYVLWVGRRVLDGFMSGEKGFYILAQAAIETNYHDAFMRFYYLDEDADLLRIHQPTCYGDGNMREDNIEEWMTLYFKKLLCVNSTPEVII